MEFPLYIGSTKAKHVIEYTFSNYACTILSRAKRDTICTKLQVKQVSTQNCEEVVQIISKNHIDDPQV
jgi:hypothetical protein